MIDNLISNALKFTPAGGRVEVRASERSGRARIEIADTGMGISPEEQERLFERFYRTAQAQTDAVPGVGLGLSIAKAIVEAHGGTISCESVEGRGTTFAIELPLAAQPAAVVAASTNRTTILPRMTGAWSDFEAAPSCASPGPPTRRPRSSA